MIEFHVDDHPSLQDLANKKNPVFGGGMSVRAPGSKPNIVLGQDEAVFNENLTSSKQWVGPNGERPILPKNNGLGQMVSAFQSRDLGWEWCCPKNQFNR
jgi:hypothetical protein